MQLGGGRFWYEYLGVWCVLSCCELCVEMVQPIAYTESQNLEIVSTTLLAIQNFAHGIYDWYHVVTWY